jgi:hypothetical protein
LAHDWRAAYPLHPARGGTVPVLCDRLAPETAVVDETSNVWSRRWTVFLIVGRAFGAAGLVDPVDGAMRQWRIGHLQRGRRRIMGQFQRVELNTCCKFNGKRP